MSSVYPWLVGNQARASGIARMKNIFPCLLVAVLFFACRPVNVNPDGGLIHLMKNNASLRLVHINSGCFHHQRSEIFISSKTDIASRPVHPFETYSVRVHNAGRRFGGKKSVKNFGIGNNELRRLNAVFGSYRSYRSNWGCTTSINIDVLIEYPGGEKKERFTQSSCQEDEKARLFYFQSIVDVLKNDNLFTRRRLHPAGP